MLIQSSVVTRKKPCDLPIVSDLKGKASQVKSAGVKSYGTARERFSGQSSSTTTGKAKPPPPPPIGKASSSSSSNQRSSFVGRTQASADPSGTTTDEIDWANLSSEDKQAFFGWLDEFFARYLDGPSPPSSSNARNVPTSKSSNNITPAPPPPRSSPSLSHRRVSSRASQNTGPGTQDEVAPTPAPAAPAVARRNLPPMLSSQQGPVCPHSCVGYQTKLLSWLRTAKDQLFHKTTRSHSDASAAFAKRAFTLRRS